MKNAIKKAIEGGWKPVSWFDPYKVEGKNWDNGMVYRIIYGTQGERTLVYTHITL